MERWKVVKEAPDYMVSSHGRLRSHKRGKISDLNPPLDKYGYRNVVLSVAGKKVNFKVHRLVANAFLCNPEGMPEVNHKDEVRDNNHVDNLEWCTGAYNVDYSQASEYTVVSPEGDIVHLRNVKRFCEEHGLSGGTFTDMLKGRRKQHKGWTLRET